MVTESSSPDEFEFLGMIGRGTLGRVFLARHKPSGKFYAVKRISKTEICRRKNIKGVLSEIDTLNEASSPFVIHLFAALQDKKFIYLVEDYAAGGELYRYMVRKFPNDVAKFYFVEYAYALQYIHRNMLTVFRDLKPENILLDHCGHLRIIDFGFAVKLDHADAEIPKACGTSQYMAPELLKKGGRHGQAVDWWAAGCILYEMLTGKAPFGDIGDNSKWEIYMKVSRGKAVSFPRHVCEPARDLIRNLLQTDPGQRYRWEQVRNHAWLKGIDWRAVGARKLVPPMVPKVGAAGDRTNYPEPYSSKADAPEVSLSASQLAYCDIQQPRAQDD